MPSKLDAAANPAYALSATGNNANAVVTITSPTQLTMVTIYITGVILSGSAAPAAGVAATLSGVLGADGTSKTLTWQIPNAAFTPMINVFNNHPIKILPGTNAVLTLPALGAAVNGTATLVYYFGTV